MRALTFLFGLAGLISLGWLFVIFTTPLARKVGLMKRIDKKK